MLQRTRCAVVADGFYEWSGPADSIDRRPFWFHRPDDGLILVAGLWQWRDMGEGYLQEFTIVTTAANSMLTPIHDRMPAILEGDALALWLSPKSEMKDLPGLLAPASQDLLRLQPVSPLVNSVKNDSPELLKS